MEMLEILGIVIMLFKVISGSLLGWLRNTPLGTNNSSFNITLTAVNSPCSTQTGGGMIGMLLIHPTIINNLILLLDRLVLPHVINM